MAVKQVPNPITNFTKSQQGPKVQVKKQKIKMFFNIRKLKKKAFLDPCLYKLFIFLRSRTHCQIAIILSEHPV